MKLRVISTDESQCSSPNSGIVEFLANFDVRMRLLLECLEISRGLKQGA